MMASRHEFPEPRPNFYPIHIDSGPLRPWVLAGCGHERPGGWLGKLLGQNELALTGQSQTIFIAGMFDDHFA
jgi:hypothetical protein